MLKTDLENGAIVKTRNGEKYILLLNVTLFNPNYVDVFVNLKTGFYIFLSNYDENLKDESGEEEFDIMAVYQPSYVGFVVINHIASNSENWTWKREELEEF